jgi:hypothetical protein
MYSVLSINILYNCIIDTFKNGTREEIDSNASECGEYAYEYEENPEGRIDHDELIA